MKASPYVQNATRALVRPNHIILHAQWHAGNVNFRAHLLDDPIV